jgi:hypothetical protein
MRLASPLKNLTPKLRLHFVLEFSLPLNKQLCNITNSNNIFASLDRGELAHQRRPKTERILNGMPKRRRWLEGANDDAELATADDL